MGIHILGICGTFMAGVAMLARDAGFEVSGSDAHAYPPMSTQLAAQGIRVQPGYDPVHLEPAPDQVVVGNVMTRGNPAVEAVLDRGMRYTSGPQWLADHVLAGRHVLAVAGTHGKTTTATILAWVLEEAGLSPGFLIGGLGLNFDCSARLGEGPCFVVEADEYDTAFFDKRSKFVHYRPRTLILNNLEYDHADIFPDLAAIETQFHHLVRTVPGSGAIVTNAGDANLARVLERGCWTPVQRFGDGGEWRGELLDGDGTHFRLWHAGAPVGEVRWSQTGRHNVSNAVAAIAAAAHVGVAPERALKALAGFRGVARRMQLRGEAAGVRVYDDFAHHPTAIATTLQGARAHSQGRLLAVFEPRSNTMRMGVHKGLLAEAFDVADAVFVFTPPDLAWDAAGAFERLGGRVHLCADIESLVAAVAGQARSGDQVVVMSNGAFGGIHGRLLEALAGRPA